MSKKKKLRKLKRENERLSRLVNRYVSIINKTFNGKKPEGFTPRTKPSVIRAADFDGDLPPYGNEYGCPNGCGCDGCCCPGDYPDCQCQYPCGDPRSIQVCNECAESLAENTAPEEWTDVRKKLFELGQSVLRDIGNKVHIAAREFNKDNDDFTSTPHIISLTDTNNPFYAGYSPVVLKRLNNDIIKDKYVDMITHWCKPLNFIFDHVLTHLPSSSLDIILGVYITETHGSSTADYNTRVACHQIDISVPLCNCKTPSHVINTIYCAVRDTVQNYFINVDEQTWRLETTYFSNIAEYILGLFTVSCMLAEEMGEPDFTYEFNRRFLKNEIDIPHLDSSVAIMVDSMTFENDGRKTYNEGNNDIVPIVNGSVISHSDLFNMFNTNNNQNPSPPQ